MSGLPPPLGSATGYSPKGWKEKRIVLSLCFVRLTSLRSDSIGNPPSEPGRPVADTVKGTSVRLKWTAPDENGGHKILGYDIQYGVDGSSTDQYDRVEVDQAGTSYTVIGKLEAKTSYRFAVAARNKAGEGPWSELSDSIHTNTGN